MPAESGRASDPERSGASAPPVHSLLDRRLVIVTGKGGTGKTSVCAALALAAASRGRQVLVAEVGLGEHLPRLFQPGASPVGYAGRELRRGLNAMHVDPFAALGEYLGLQLGARRVVDLALRNHAFRQLMEASPGWRELITLGKVWHLSQARSESGRPRYDMIIVDAPATGHGMTFLDVPRVVISAVRAGPLRRHAGLVESMICDQHDTLLLPVTLAEELPARETYQLVERAREEIGIALDRVVVNAVAEPPFPAGLDDLDRRLAALPADLPLRSLPSPRVLAACASFLAARHELNQSYLGQIEQRTALPVVALPYLAQGLRGAADIEVLAGALLGGDPRDEAERDAP